MTVETSIWKNLLSVKRLRSGDSAPDPDDTDNAFLSDYTRVVFAASFRRLQDKTQVNPIASNDFVRRRLTHSLEVATVGERMGRVIATRLGISGRLPKPAINRDAIGKIIGKACLLHDLGNPPFGHAGEFAIREWADKLSERESQPIRSNGCRGFDGNAQGFRIAVRLQSHGKSHGMNLTSATLDTYLKYPKVAPEVKTRGDVRKQGKFSIFPSEEHLAKAVRANTGVSAEARHPLCILMEAADDISNRLCDLEDGLKLGLVSFEEIRSTLEASTEKGKELLAHLDERYSELPHGIATKERQQLAYQHFRAMAIGTMAKSCEDEFMDRIEAIEAGEFEGDLISKTAHKETYSALK